MADRFERLFELPNNLYSTGSPVIVTAGALLKDTQTGSVIVQLKYQSVSSVLIKALRVDIVAYDIAGGEIQGKNNFQYLDLAVQNGQTFGSNKAIVMPDVTTRSFAIGSLSVVLSDGTTQNSPLPLSELPQGITLQQKLGNSELIKQYLLATNQYAQQIPCESMGLWNCACGEWNSHHACTKCNLSKDVAFEAYNIDNLSQAMNSRLKAEERAKKEQSERNAALAQQRKIRSKRIILGIIAISLIVALASVFAFWIYPNVIKPSMIYNDAQQLLVDGKYDDAATAFRSLGDYKDAEDMEKEAIFQKGCMRLDAQDFDEAIRIFQSLDNYSNAAEKETHAYYQKAMFLKDTGDVEGAISILTNLTGYLDSDSVCMQLQYDVATEYLANGQYDAAKSIFESIIPYKDSTNLVKECDYQKGCYYFENAQYIDAIEIFESIAGYLDTETQIDSAYSLYYLEQGNILYHEAKFYLAIEALQKSNEPTAAEIISNAENEIAYINSVCGEYRLVEEYWYGSKVTIGPANRDNCIVSFDFENGRFIFDNNKYVAEHSFAYNFDRNEKFHYDNHYQGGKDYDYQFVNGRLLWDEGNNTYEYYEKR